METDCGMCFLRCVPGPFLQVSRSTHEVSESVGQHVAKKLIKILRAARKRESSSPENFPGGSLGIGEYY